MLRSLGLAGMMTAVLLTGQAKAFDVMEPDYGGRVEKYEARLARAQARGEPIRIGPTECDSSCTLYLANPHSCVSESAVFGFHAPWFGGPDGGVVDPRMTAVFASHYKPGLRRIFMAHVRRHGHHAPGPMLRITGRQLAAYGYRLC
ncbi:MAG: hypothetical protein AB7F41_12595 [Methylocystis sp.]|uniref:hypothetical protein n=1 Tax=Methylocystis sp. TaxID=1911079 RepID=UPI003D1258EE